MLSILPLKQSAMARLFASRLKPILTIFAIVSVGSNRYILGRVLTMKTIFNIKALGSLHTRKRIAKVRYGIGKGDLCYMVHFGKRSLYFYPATCKRPIKPNWVFA